MSHDGIEDTRIHFFVTVFFGLFAGRDELMADFMNTWIQLKRKDGFVQSLYDYWILGKDAEPTKPRWSILRDVLHWVE